MSLFFMSPSFLKSRPSVRYRINERWDGTLKVYGRWGIEPVVFVRHKKTARRRNTLTSGRCKLTIDYKFKL
jgi:hypothetical protein